MNLFFFEISFLVNDSIRNTVKVTDQPAWEQWQLIFVNRIWSRASVADNTNQFIEKETIFLRLINIVFKFLWKNNIIYIVWMHLNFWFFFHINFVFFLSLQIQIFKVFLFLISNEIILNLFTPSKTQFFFCK